MRLLRTSLFMFSYLALSPTIFAQTFVYSGRQYLKSGQSWTQIREMDLRTRRTIQLSTSPRHHYRLWCTPDDKSILFTTELIDKTLYRFDRATKQETVLIALDQDLFAVVDTVGDSKILIQEYGGIIEIVDLSARRSVRRIVGVGPALSSDRKLLAWQSRVDVLSKVEPHILLSELTEETTTDLGEGRAPLFANPTELLFFRHQSDTSVQIVRYNTNTRTEQVRTVKAPEYGSVEDVTVSSDGKVISILSVGPLRCFDLAHP